MSTPDPAPAGLRVSGGAGGMGAQYADMEVAATALTRACLQLLVMCVDGHRWLSDADLLGSAVLAPVGAARVEVALLEALDGPDGLRAVAGRLGGRGVDLRVAVVRYRLADRLDGELTALRRHVVGTVGSALALALAPVVVQFGPLVLLASGTSKREAAGLFGDQLVSLLMAHPGIVDEMVGSAPAALTAGGRLLLGPDRGLPGGMFRAATGEVLLPTTIEEAAGLLALLYPAGTPVVRRVQVDRPPRPAPAGVGDLMLDLGAAGQEAGTREQQGHIGVTRLRTPAAGGGVGDAWIVTLPGTGDWQVDPRDERRWLNDLATNLTAVAGDETARVDGVAAALDLAGVDAADPVMLVGHSQGGLVAARAAQQWRAQGRFRVTHVVTAGAPIARIDLPPAVQVLSLENNRDVVTHLDTGDHDDLPTRTTLLFDQDRGSIAGNHAILGPYADAAALAERDGLVDHPSIRAWLDSADAFLTEYGEEVDVERETYDVRNRVP